MRLGKAAAVISLALILLWVAGCQGEPKVDDKGPKKTIDTYLQGFKDKDPEKIYQVVTYEAYRDLKIPGKIDQLFREQSRIVGDVQSWEYEDEPFVDELNNQALIKTKIKATKSTFTLEFDLRRTADTWQMYGVKEVSATDKSGKF